MLLNSLPKAYQEVKNALKYERDSRTTNIIIAALRTKEIQLQSTKKDQSSNEGVLVKGNFKPN